jgi:hypothetical protein
LKGIVGVLAIVCVVLIWHRTRDTPTEDFSSSTMSANPVVGRPPDPSPPGARAFAVVDVQRILVALARSRPREKFDTAMAGEIQQAVAALAVERNLDVVFDRSGRSKNEVPAVLVSPSTADLTDAAIQRLGP